LVRANVNLHVAAEPVGALMLGHGARGGVTARDLVAVTAVATSGSTLARPSRPAFPF
jgi:hypothetical protein